MIYPINYLGAIMRAFTFFKRNLTHNNVVSGTWGDSSLYSSHG
jgi:hypothetical protein